jgi:hypothetical protein
MTVSFFNRYAFSTSMATALLAGCGGSQPPIGALGAMPQGRAVATHHGRGGSWMLPKARSEDLLYVSDPEKTDVYVYSYRSGQLVGTLTGFSNLKGFA